MLLVHRLLSRPQLIGTSRHITGAYSIEDLTWNEKTNTLQGRSETVPGADYTLFLHLPPGTPPTVNATATAGGNPLTVRQERTGDLLSVTFKSQQSPVVWQARFPVEGVCFTYKRTQPSPTLSFSLCIHQLDSVTIDDFDFMGSTSSKWIPDPPEAAVAEVLFVDGGELGEREFPLCREG